MAIACVYCGGSHEAPADVRECWERTSAEPPTSPAPPDPAASIHVPDPDGTGRRHEAEPIGFAEPRGGEQTTDPGWIGRGPARLGRHAIVSSDAPSPAGWEGAERLVIGTADLAEPITLLDRLRTAWDEASSLIVVLAPEAAAHPVLEVDPSSPMAPIERTDRPSFELGPRHEFVLDHLWHLLFANAVDLRRLEHPRWWLFDRALALGATPSDDPDQCDVILPDGRPAWLDGGPPRRLPPTDGVLVLHAAIVEHGSLAPPVDVDAPAVLAPDQTAAVEHDQGSARIIAPAGSGKTRVLTERARRLVTAWRVPPSAIGLVAFNARAQQEMRERTADLTGLQVRTLNSIALAILNGTRPFAPRPRRVRTITEPEVRRILDRLVRVTRRRNTDPLATWIEALGLIRLGLVPPAEVEARYDGEVDGLAEMWPRFLGELERDGVVDFDGQVHGALGVLLGDPDARAAAQRVCRHLLVDEFQDLTPAHLLLIRLLAGPAGAVFGVGDDDQTIYGYNGADPAWLIEFAQFFPGAAAHPLEVNYRCPADVVEAADRLVRHNRRRVPKRIRPAPDRVVDAAGWSVLTSDDPVTDTVGHVQRVVDAGTAPDQIAVLARVNVLLVPVQVALSEAGVPVGGVAGVELLDRTAVRAVLAWLRLADGSRFGSVDLAEALRRPSRSLRPRIADWAAEQRDLDGLHRLARRLDDETSAQRVAAFADDLGRLADVARAGGSSAELVGFVIDEIGLGGAVSTLDRSRRGMNRAAQGDELTALRQLAALHDSSRERGSAAGLGFEDWLRAQLQGGRSADGVVLASVHRVKGQEWPEVVLHQADRSQYPHRLADDVEEERRVFHVGLTRASRHVAVVTGPEPSRFVAELTSEPPVHRAPDPDLDAGRRAGRRSAPAAGPAGGSAGGRRSDHPLLDRSTVIVVPGMVLVDHGTEWRVVEVGPDDVLTESATGSRRRFGYGLRVRTTGRQQGSASPAAGLDRPVAALIYDELRRYRDLIRDGKPAYTVFDDRTLVEIAERCPTDRAALAAVRGVGPAKLERYGEEVLAIVLAVLPAFDG